MAGEIQDEGLVLHNLSSAVDSFCVLCWDLDAFIQCLKDSSMHPLGIEERFHSLCYVYAHELCC